MQPTIVELPAFHVVGLSGTYSAATRSQIPELWARFVPRMDEIPGRKGEESYGLCTPSAPGPDGVPVFVYTAAVEVDTLDSIPDGLVGFTVPAATYARFTHTGHVSTIDQTVDAIGSSWLPKGPSGNNFAAFGRAPGCRIARNEEECVFLTR